jgi:WD40 repeat protein
MTTPTPDREPPSPHDLPTVIQESGLSSSDSGIKTQAAPGASPMRREISLPPLTRIGDYELLGEVGRGGMGVVFKARDVRLGRIVALKMLSGGVLARPDDLHRFQTEAAAAAQLQHPSIVALYDVGTFDNLPYFSMEFIDGSSLAQRVTVGVVPSRLAASYLERVARAVHFAHSRGILHRDLKPANILLDDQDQPKITDFGLAKLLQSDSGQTRTGTVIGTPSYMAPEQANASKDIGPACDIYSLGAILYELLTNHPPFLGETALATLNMVAERDPVAPHLLNPSVDRDLETICLKCLEKEPARRYATAQELGDDLRRYLNGEPIRARRLGAPGRAWKWARRRPAGAALLVVTVCALLGFGLIQWRVAVNERALRKDAESAHAEVVEREQSLRQREQLLRHLYYLGQMRQVHTAWREADLRRAEDLLKNWLPRPDQKDLRGWEWYYLHSLCSGNRTFAGHSGRVTSVAYSADGRWLASAGGEPGQRGEVKLWDTATGRLLRTLPPEHEKAINKVVFSPDGTLLATASDDETVRLWDPETGEARAVLRGHTNHVTSVAFAPDGSRLISVGDDRVVIRWDITKQHPPRRLQTLREHTAWVTCVAYSPQGDVFATGSLDETVRLWDAHTGQVLHVLRGHQGEVTSVAFGPSGKVLVSGGGPDYREGQVKLWDVAGGKLLRTHFGLSDRILDVAVGARKLAAPGGGNRNRLQVAAVSGDGKVFLWDEQSSSEALTFRADTQRLFEIAFSPDGEKFATGGKNSLVRIWNSSGGQEGMYMQGSPYTECIRFSPDGKYLASAGRSSATDGRIFLWDAATGRMVPLKGTAGQVNGLAFSPNSRFLASARKDRTVRIYNLESQEPPQILSGHIDAVLAVAYSPNGRMLASGDQDGTLRFWDAATGQPRGELPGHGSGVLSLAFSPDSRSLAVGYNKVVRLWDVQQRTYREFKGHLQSVNTVVFSPDGSQVASGSKDQTIRIWDVASGKEFLRLEGSVRSVTALAYHPDGKRLASVGADRLVRLWDLVTRQEILQLDGPTGTLRSVDFSRDGWRLAAGGDHTGIHVWDARLVTK